MKHATVIDAINKAKPPVPTWCSFCNSVSFKINADVSNNVWHTNHAFSSLVDQMRAMVRNTFGEVFMDDGDES